MNKLSHKNRRNNVHLVTNANPPPKKNNDYSADTGLTPEGLSILSDVEALLTNQYHRNKAETALQAALQSIAHDILSSSTGH